MRLGESDEGGWEFAWGKQLRRRRRKEHLCRMEEEALRDKQTRNILKMAFILLIYNEIHKVRE